MSYREAREKYKTVCTDCYQECEVPFKTEPSRPITGEKLVIYHLRSSQLQ